MFYTVMVRHPMGKWQVLRSSNDVRDAMKDIKILKDTELRTVVVKTDVKSQIKKAQVMCNRSIKSVPKKRLLDFTKSGIEAARLKTVS